MKIHKYILKIFRKYPLLLSFLIFNSIRQPKIILVTLPILFLVIGFNMIGEYYEKYNLLYYKILDLIDKHYMVGGIFNTDYEKWAKLKYDMTVNHIGYTLNPLKIKKGIEYLYNNYNFFPEIKQEVREAKLNQLV